MSSKRKVASNPPQILSASYLEGAKNTSDLLKRLKIITEHLSEEDVEPHSPHYPGLASLATYLVAVNADNTYVYLNHKDKDVRLHSVLACMELFYIYAPEPPWNEDEIIEIFQQMIRQLGNLATCIPTDLTVSNQLHQYEAYFRILEQLSEVKIGVVLVDLVRTEQAPHALETLCELIKTILTCVHVDHPPEVAQHAESAVAACVEEFEGNIPNPVLDELLLPVGNGPVTYITDPKSKENPPAQIQQTNPSYLVAAKVLRKTEDKVSSPIAQLLNGIFSGDPNTLKSTSLSAEDSTESPPSLGKKRKKGGKDTSSPTLPFTKEVSAGDVYSITYELHRIIPMILTTVIGTVASNLTNTDVDKRLQATKLLGRLFGARTSDIAKKFGPCFRVWLRRSYDQEGVIRETMIKCLTNFLSTQYNETELCRDVSEALSVIIKMEKITEIRVYAIHQVCELAHQATSDDAYSAAAIGGANRRVKHPISTISAELLNAVGSRVSSKYKTERKDAITGLAQIYYKHYITKKLQYIQEGGDDANIDEILDVFSKENVDKALEDKFGWIPQKVFESVFFSDEQDPDLRSRIFQIVDDVLLGTVKKDGAMLTATSRAVGLAMILQSLQKKESANKWMYTLLTHRSNLQRSLGAYLDARSKSKECESDSAEAFTADADAMEKLEKVAVLCSPPLAGKPSEASDLESVLRKFHTAKDKHIFRILSTIATSTHSPSARLRAFDELPNRTKCLGNATSSWVKSLARRCAMGSFVNAESIEHCILLSQECFEAGDCEAASYFLRCVKMATSIFPALGGTNEGFKNLAEFFDSSRTTVMTSAMKRDMEKFGIVTMISDILAKSASSRTGKKEKDTESIETLRTQLHRTCTREGSPEQARNAVYAIAAMMNPRSKPITDLSVRSLKEKNEFEPILKVLVNPSRLAIPDDYANSKTKDRIISVLTAITAIAECAPFAFNASGEGSKLGCGERAIKFALNTALLGRNTRLDTSREDGSESEVSCSDDESPEKSGRKGTKGKKNSVSVHCQMMCGAIELLATHIRSTIVSSRRTTKNAELVPPSSAHIAEVFSTLTKILEDGGVPPSSVNGRYCKTSLDRAALRRSAAVNLLRLCDSGLKLEGAHLTPKMWHVLSNVFLDDEASVRDGVTEELSFMLSGTGKYCHGGIGSAPSMQFIAFVTLCAEGSKAGKVKTSMMQSIAFLRGSIAKCQAQVRAMGKDAERNFENNLKKKLMPEYCVPYALHLLAFRHETASAAGTLAGEEDSDVEMESKELALSEEASEKRLKKRLKFLFDPLIQSLGERADNISFLLRMVELIGKFTPVNVMKCITKFSSLETSLDDDSEEENDNEEKEAAARMKIICQFAREVLLSHVKKDFNLTVYPGGIQIPGQLYSRNLNSPANVPIRYESDDSFERPTNKRPKKSISHYINKNQDLSDDDKSIDEKVDDEESVKEQTEEHFDDCDNGVVFSPSASDSEGFDKGLDDMSPIAKNVSPLVDAASPSPEKKRAPRAKIGGNKRKSSDIDIFEDEMASPATYGVSSPVLSNNKRHKKITPKVSSSGKKKKSSEKSKPTPVSITKKAMITITNSQSSSSASSTKKRVTKKQAKKGGADESFDFPDSPPKKGGKKKISMEHSRKKSPPARKTTTSAKKAKLSASSPSTTSEASSRASRAFKRRAVA